MDLYARRPIRNIFSNVLGGLGLAIEWLSLIYFSLIFGGPYVLSALFPLCFMLINIQCGPGPDSADVSSLYGPGTFLAWLVSFLFIMLVQIDDYWCRSSWFKVPAHRRRSSIPPPPPTLDTLSFSGFYIYAAFASIDALVRLAKGSMPEHDAQGQAALVVCRYAIFIATVAWMVSVVTGTRLWPWRLLFFTCAVPLLVSPFKDDDKWPDDRAFDYVRGVSSLLLAVCSFANTRKEVTARRYCVPVTIYLCAGMGLTWLSVSLQFNMTCPDIGEGEHYPTFSGAWPRSNVGWLDLDQIAAMAAASVILGLSFFTKRTRGKRIAQKMKRLISRSTRRHHNSIQESGGDYGSDISLQSLLSDDGHLEYLSETDTEERREHGTRLLIDGDLEAIA